MSFPQELKDKRRWVCWRLEPDKDGEKPRKMPINPVTGKGAMSNNPKTWTDYQAAFEAYEKYGYTGIGYMFTREDGYVGVDVDHCYNAETGEFSEAAKVIIAKQPTYVEFSPSGDGIHLYFKGKKPSGSSKNSETGVEMYEAGRYFTVTEKQLSGSLDIIAEDNGTLAWIHENFIKKKKKARKKKSSCGVPIEMTDEELIEKAKTSEDGDAFTALLEGNWQGEFPSQSEADMAFCRKLAFWSGKNKEQMERIFRSSGLFRQKWDEKHTAAGATYGEETLDKAIESTESIYSPSGDSPVFEFQGRYWRSKGEATYPITNFVFKPVEMIISEDETQLSADLVTVRGETYRLTFMTTDFSNQQKFKNLLNKNTISLSYLGSDGDLELLKGYVSELKWEEKRGVKAMGIYEHDGRLVFVCGDDSIECGGVAVPDIVQLDKYKGMESGIISCDTLSKEKLLEIGKLLMSYNEPAKAISILAWTSGCFIKEHLRLCGIKFPHLFLIGEAGSGKSTTLERVILPIFSTGRIIAATQVTAFTLMKESASSNLIPLPLDEFKPSKIDRLKLSTLYNHFRDSYDGHQGIRGRADLSTVTYNLSAPLIVAGEESADEAAIRERSIELLFSKKDLKNTDHRMAFNRILSTETLLSDFGRTLLNTVLKISSADAEKWYIKGKDKFNPELPSRIVNNLACCYAGLRLLERVCAGFSLAFDTVFPFSMDHCIKYMEFAAKDYLLDGGTNNRSIVEQTFEIMSRMKLDPKVYYKIDDGRLYLWLTPVYDLYTKYRKDYAIVGEVLTYAQFKKQLQHSEYFIASNEQKRIGTENRKCWVIDYMLLGKNCDISGFEVTEIEPLTM